MTTITMITTTVKLTRLRPGWPGYFAQFTRCLAKITLDRVLAFLLFIFLSQGRYSFTYLTAKTPPDCPTAALALHLQARQDLNPQPLVLETSALPIELLAYNVGQGQYIDTPTLNKLTSSRDAAYAS